MEDEDATPITQEFPEEPSIELTDDEIVALLIEWSPVIGDA